jgi:hypothetical protein
MADLINQAVRQLVGRFRDAAAATPVVAPSGDKSAVEKLQELLQQYEETNKARTDLEVSRQVLHEELDEIRAHIAREKAKAEGLIEEDLEHINFLGTADFDREMKTILARVFEGRKAALASDGSSPEATAELGQLQAPMQDLVFRLIREQRQRFRVRTGAGSKEISMLEKRIEKLYAQLGALENALQMISSSKVQSNQAVLNALRQLGLVNEDKYFEKKREMLKVVLDANKGIRQSAKDLEARGITLASPRGTAAAS